MKLLRIPDAGSEGAGGSAEVFAEPGQQPEVQPQAAPQTGLSKDDIAEVLKKANIGQAATQQAAPEERISPEEFDRRFNVTRADETLFRNVFGIEGDTQVSPERLAAFNQFTQGLVKQAVTMAAFQIQAVEGKLQQHVNPAVEYARAQQHEKLKGEFFKEHKDLEPYEPLVTEVYQKLAASGFKGDKTSVFKAIAEQSRGILKSLPGNLLDATAGQNNPVGQQQQSKPAHRMSTVSTGGQSGAGGGGKSAPKTGPAAIFG